MSECDHGQLARTCLLCEMRDENLALRAQVAAWEDASQCGHPNPCTLGPLCPYCEIGRLKDKLADCQAVNDGLRADAERYRCFRETFGIAVPDDDGAVIWFPEEIDKAIDKARGA